MWINRDYFRILKKVRLDQNQNSSPSNEVRRNQARIRLYSNPDSDPENQKKQKTGDNTYSYKIIWSSNNE